MVAANARSDAGFLRGRHAGSHGVCGEASSRGKAGAPLLPKAALWLMNHRNEGYWWSSTKQTAMVIYGLTDYLRATNELKPNLTATVFVNGALVLTRKIDQATGAESPELMLDEASCSPA